MHSFHAGLHNRPPKHEGTRSKLDIEDMKSPNKGKYADEEVFSRQMSIFRKNSANNQEERKESIKSVGSQK